MGKLRTVAFVALLLAEPAEAQDLQAGLKAAADGDYFTALKQWRPLAERGDAAAQNNLGALYANGHGVAQDYREAAKWYGLAAAQGDENAQTSLGAFYAKGQGVPQDFSKALYWFRLAAEQGDHTAQVSLGALYANGQGVPQDYVEAHMRFNIGCARGSELGCAYREKIAAVMTPADISAAQRRARSCVKRDFKNCD